MGEFSKLQTEVEEYETCISYVSDELTGKMKNLKDGVIHLKDEIMKIMAVKVR